MTPSEEKLARLLQAEEELKALKKELEKDVRNEKLATENVRRSELMQSLKDLRPYTKYSPFPKLDFRWSSKHKGKIKVMLNPDNHTDGIYHDGPCGSLIIALLRNLQTMTNHIDPSDFDGVMKHVSDEWEKQKVKDRANAKPFQA